MKQSRREYLDYLNEAYDEQVKPHLMPIMFMITAGYTDKQIAYSIDLNEKMFQEFKKDIPELSSLFEKKDMFRINLCEQKLMDAVLGGDVKAITFYLTHRGDYIPAYKTAELKAKQEERGVMDDLSNMTKDQLLAIIEGGIA